MKKITLILFLIFNISLAQIVAPWGQDFNGIVAGGDNSAITDGWYQWVNGPYDANDDIWSGWALNPNLAPGSNGEYTLYHDDDEPSSGTVDNYFITPVLDCTELTNPILRYTEWGVWQSYYYFHGVYYSEDYNGSNAEDATWVELTQGEAPTSPTMRQFNIPSSTTAIAFRYQGDWADNWLIDDIQVIDGPEPVDPLTVPTIDVNGITYNVSVMNDFLEFSVDGDWDFSGIETDFDSTIEIAPVSSSSYSSDYPNATHVKFEDGFEFFLGFQNSEYTFHGERSIINTAYESPLIMHTYPFNVGDNHNDSVSDEPFDCTNCPPYMERDDAVQTVGVSSGSVTMPNGVVVEDVILVHTTRTFTDGQVGSSPCITTLDMWHWWADGFAIPIVQTSIMGSTGQCPANDVLVTKFIDGALSLNSFDILEMVLFPNPADTNYVTIQSPVDGIKEVEVFDIVGKRVINTNLISDSLEIGELNPGVYMIKVTVENQSKVSKLIIK